MLGVRKSKETYVGSPVFPTRLGTECLDSKRNLVEAALISIRAGIMQFSLLRQELLPVDPPPLTKLGLRPFSRIYDQVGVEFASDGFKLRKLTKAVLVDYSHRMVMPTRSGEPEYLREGFNVDSQCITPQPVCLRGIDEISSDPNAVVEVLSFERDIVYASLTKWASLVVR